MIDVVVLTTIVCAAVFAAAWLLRPDFRAWIERPKHRFQENVRSYDQERGKNGNRHE